MLSIDNILQFLPDFVVVETFKSEICLSLEQYNKSLNTLRAETEDYKRNSISIQDESSGVCTRSLSYIASRAVRELKVAHDLVRDEDHRALVPHTCDPVFVPGVEVAPPRHDPGHEEHDDGLALAGINLTAHVFVASTNISSNDILSCNRTEISRLLVATFAL